MIAFEKKSADVIVNSQKTLKSADNLMKAVMPAANEPRILLKVLEILYKEEISLISFILKYEHVCKRVKLGKDNVKNLKVFFDKCIFNYGLDKKDRDNLRMILILGKKHRQSGFEFVKHRKIIILDDDLNVNEVDNQMIEGFISSLKKLVDGMYNKIYERNNN